MKLLCLFLLLVFINAIVAKKTQNSYQKSEICARKCYFRTVAHVSPIKVFGLISIFIRHQNPKYNSKQYLTEIEAFQNLCWTYRGFTKNCLLKCQNNILKQWLNKVFFAPLEKYCVKFYEEIVENWQCIKKLKKYRQMCDRECAGICDRKCLFFCFRPVARRLCGTENPAHILREISELRSPLQNNSSRRVSSCFGKVVNYVKIKARVEK